MPSLPMQVVHLLHSCELVLLDRLAAMALVVAAPPKVTGAFSGWTYEYIVAPLHGHFEVRSISFVVPVTLR